MSRIARAAPAPGASPLRAVPPGPLAHEEQ
jgi:hypothetical protein